MTHTDEYDARTTRLLAQERASPELPEGFLWWCSFVATEQAAPRGEQVPGGPGFLGVAVVDAPGPMHATLRTHALGINPGGEVAFFPVLADDVPPEYRDRFLDRPQLRSLGYDV